MVLLDKLRYLTFLKALNGYFIMSAVILKAIRERCSFLCMIEGYEYTLGVQGISYM